MATATFDKPLNEDLAKLESHLDDIGIVVDGNKTSYASGAAQGQYVVLKNSSIVDSGSDMLADGLYTAAKAIPYNTVIDKTYLTQCSGGGLNALNSKTWQYLDSKNGNINIPFPSTATELLAIVHTGQTGNFSIIIPVDYLTSANNTFYNTYDASAAGGGYVAIGITATTTGLSLTTLYTSYSGVTLANSTLTVYYK